MKLFISILAMFAILLGSMAYATNPVFVDVPKGAWKKVATNVLKGNIGLTSGRSTMCNATFKDTGDAAPTSALDGVPVFELISKIAISNTTAIDVYLWCVNRDGRVSVAL